MDTILQQVVDFLKTEKTWFEFEGSGDPKRISFSTRDNGDTYEETPGKSDIEEARRLSKLLRDKFAPLNVRLDTCDEWVSLSIDSYPKYYSADALKKRLGEMGYAVGMACGGTNEAVMIKHQGKNIAVVSATGMALTLCLEPSSVFIPLSGKVKVVINVIENIANGLKEIAA